MATTSTTTTTTTATEDYGGVFVTGDSATDHGNEIYGYIGSMDIRLLANDAAKVQGCMPDFYYISTAMMNEIGALIVQGNGHQATFTASNFTSPWSGKKYRWMGWTIEKSANPLVTTNPLTLTEPKGTLRVYWATVQ